MSRYLRVALLVLVASCGGNYDPPRNLDNACAIVAERPEFLRAMQKSEERWGVPVAVQMSTIYHESRFVGDARTPHRYALGVIPMGRQSSAYGYSQAIDDTWDLYRSDTGRGGARRDRIGDATDFMGWYMNRSYEKLGIPKTDARRQYLAYHEGHAGYARGSYREKSWLLSVAQEVEVRALLYDTQLRSCGKV